MSTFPVIIKGLTGSLPSIGGSWEGTVNLWQDDEGYLANYPGKTDYFHRVVQPDTEPAWRGVAPAVADEYTRIFAFIDFTGVPHLVVVKGSGLYEVYGNSLVLLHTIKGLSVEGLYYPTLFQHESKLILLNDGDIPHIWNGVDGVQPLGVQETPMAPQVWSTPAPGSDDPVKDSVWRWSHLWWPQTIPVSGPCQGIDADDAKVPGLYQLRVQYKDQYGNRGPASAASDVEKVDGRLTVTDVVGTDFENPRFLGCDWLPPQHDTHIRYVEVGRTVNQHPDCTTYTPTASELYFVSGEYEGTTLSRHVSQLPDADLILSGEMDLMVQPPFSAVGGCSAKGRVFLFRDNTLEWSDALLFGQYRVQQQHVAYDHLSVTRLVGDRIAVISRSSIEVLYELQGGAFGILDQDFSQGSEAPQSFVDVGGGIFGLFSRGFGYFDGVKVTYVETPYYLQNLYQDQTYRITDAVLWKGRYVAVLRKDFVAADSNYLLIYDFKTTNWFLLQETVRGLCVFQDQLYGVSDSIYELFKGTFPQATLQLSMLAPEGTSVFESKALAEVRLRMEPSSAKRATLTVSAIESVQRSEAQFPLLPGDQNTAERDVYLLPYWNKVGAEYASQPAWQVPGETILTPTGGLPVNGASHNLRLSIPSGHLFRMSALLVQYGSPSTTTEYA